MNLHGRVLDTDLQHQGSLTRKSAVWPWASRSLSAREARSPASVGNPLPTTCCADHHTTGWQGNQCTGPILWDLAKTLWFYPRVPHWHSDVTSRYVSKVTSLQQHKVISVSSPFPLLMTASQLGGCNHPQSNQKDRWDRNTLTNKLCSLEW